MVYIYTQILFWISVFLPKSTKVTKQIIKITRVDV